MKRFIPNILHRCIKQDSGFTLIELLVSIFIFALVMSMIYGAYKTVLTSAETVKHGDVPFEEGRSAMERIAIDLTGLYVSHEAEYNLAKKDSSQDPYSVKLERISYSGKNFSKLSFVSSAHVSFTDEGEGIHSRITIYAVQDKDGSFSLRRSDKRFPDNTNSSYQTDPILCRNLTQFSVEAIDKSGSGTDIWDTDAGTGSGELPFFFSIILEASSGESKALFKQSVPVRIKRMRNVSEPDNPGASKSQEPSGGKDGK